MCVSSEIIVLFFLISFFIYTMPIVLVKFSRTVKGKLLLIVLTIVMTLYNRTAGLLMVMLVIFLAEFNYEVNNGILYEGYANIQDNIEDNIQDNIEEEEVKKLRSTNDIIGISHQLTAQNSRM